MPKMHLKQPECTYSAYGPFKDRIQKFKVTGNSRYIYQNKLDKACFEHYMAYRDFKDLLRRTASDKVLCHKAFNISSFSHTRPFLVPYVYVSIESIDCILLSLLALNAILLISSVNALYFSLLILCYDY